MNVFKKKALQPLATREVETGGAHRKVSQMYEISGVKCTSPAVCGRIHNIGFAMSR
jgi:hypothetical protein